MNSYDRIYNLLVEGKSTGGDVHSTMDRIAYWREMARQNPDAKPGEPGYIRKAFPRNVNPDFPGEAEAQHKRGVRVIRRVIRGGEMTRAHKDTEREVRGDREGRGVKQVPAGILRTHAPGKEEAGDNTKVMGYDDDGKFIYPKGKKQARVAARSGAEQGATRARREKQ